MLDPFDCGICVPFDLLFGGFVFDVLKGNLDDMPHLFNHVLNVAGCFFSVWVDWCLPCAREMVLVANGCSQLGLDHITFPLSCKHNLLGTH
jgi:hypothetical protein